MTEHRHIDILGRRVRLILEDGDKPVAELQTGEYQAVFLRLLAERLEAEEKKPR